MDKILYVDTYCHVIKYFLFGTEHYGEIVTKRLGYSYILGSHFQNCYKSFKTFLEILHCLFG